MNNETEEICRICLKTVYKNTFEEVKDITKQMMELLLMKLDLDISKNPMICNHCANNLQKSFDFKSKCLYAEKIIDHFSSRDEKLDIKEVYLKNNSSVEITISDEQQICRLCIQLIEKGSYTYLKEIEKDKFVTNEILQKHFPELNIHDTEEPIICSHCHSSVQSFSNFLTVCLDVEKKITEYVETKGTDKHNRVKLNNVQKCMVPPVLQHKMDGDINAVVEMDELSETEVNIKKEFKINHEQFMETMNTEIHIKNEVEEHIVKDTGTDSEDFVEGDLEIKSEEIDIKSESSDCISSEEITKGLRSGNLKKSKKRTKKWKQKLKCKKCPYKTENKHHLNRHLLVHASTSTVKMHKCKKCTFETKYETYLQKHMMCHVTDRKIYKCDQCPFKSLYEKAYQKHLLYHTNPSLVKVYKCEECKFETLHESAYRYHILNHKDASKITMLKCDSCTYETKHRLNLVQHVLIHRDPSKIKMIQCDKCEFNAKNKNILRNHMITHKDFLELTMFKCKICAYESKYKYAITKHELGHRDPSEIPIYKCDVCTYETRYKGSLKNHKETHNRK